MATCIFFKDLRTNGQPEENMQVKKSNAPFCCYSSSDNVITAT